MATEKLRAELELITSKAEKDLKRFDRSLAGVERRITSMGGRGGKSLKPLGEGLSAATVNANEFEKSMAAANARVIAFGASAGLIFQVQKALKETVRATIEVEKALTDINVVLNTNAAGLQKFGDQLFKVAAQTGQSFKTIAVGATELARQGLGTEKTLKRLNDAMVLSRLTGMGAEEAVSSLTAAVNSFNKVGITSAQVVNKMAKVDQAFAVSSDDLAKAISRVGSSAVDAGVSMDELLAITTAVQQRTARGGAVIGNAFKTIFTRIGRTDVQKKLANIGVATRDMQGAMLPATKVLENLSAKFKDLSQNQQNQIAESVAGVFQVNVLRAALGDLSSKYGIYSRALRESASATDEAYKKNEQLNQTLSAMVNKTLANLTKAGAGIGGATLKPAIENVLNLVNSAIGSFGEGGRFEEFGKGIGKNILKGIGDFIAGPGLAIVTVGIAKLAVNFASFTKEAIAGMVQINKTASARRSMEAQVTAELQRQPGIIAQIERGEISAAAAARDMLASMRASNVEASKLAITSRAISANMVGIGGGFAGGRLRGMGRAQGFVPNFANPNAERASAAMGGYKAGAIRTMSIPGQGSVMYNSAETVKQFPGMQQPAIMPPQRSLAGANYKKSFGAAHGFDPYAAGGFVPNFNIGAALGATRATANMTLDQAIKAGMTRQQLSPAFGKQAVDARLGMVSAGGKPVTKGVDKFKDAFDARGQIGIVALTGGSNRNARVSTSIGQLKAFKPFLSGLTPSARKKAEAETIAFTGIQVSSLDVLRKNLKSKGRDSFNFSREINQELIDPLARIGARAVGGVLGNQADKVSDIKRAMGGKRLLPTGTEGELFEKAMQLALHSKTRFMQAIGGTDNAPFDFEEAGSPTKKFKDTLGFSSMLQRADAKRTASSGALRSLIKKSYNQGILIEAGLAKGPLFKEGGALPFMGRMSAGNIQTAAGKLRGTVGAAGGLVPNFSPLTDAITRERAAGVPASAIRVGSSPALKSSGNPGGLGVYNTIHEPAGLGQGISRSRRMGINPKAHGVPNFAPVIDMPAGYVMPGSGRYAGPMSGAGFAAAIGQQSFFNNYRPPQKPDPSAQMQMKSAEKLAMSVDKFNTGVGHFMTFGSMIGFMAAPAINERLGLEANDQRIQMGLTGAFMGQMVGAGAGSAAGFVGTHAGRAGAALSKSAGSRAGMLARGLGMAGTGMSAAGRFVPHPLVKGGLMLGGTALGAFMGQEMGKEDPTDRALRKRTEAANKEMAEAQEALNAGEAFVNGLRDLAGNFNQLQGPQRTQAFDSLQRSYDTFITTLSDSDAKKVREAFNNLTKSLVDQSGVSKSAENLEKVIGELGESLDKVKKSAEGAKSAIELETLFRETNKGAPTGGSNIYERVTGGPAFERAAARAEAARQAGNITMAESMRRRGETPVYPDFFDSPMDMTLQKLGGLIDPNFDLAKPMGATPDITAQEQMGFRQSRLLPGGKKFAKAAAEKIIKQSLTDIRKELSFQITTYGTRPDTVLSEFEAGGLGGIANIIGNNDDLKFLESLDPSRNRGTTNEIGLQREIMRQVAAAMSPTGLALFGQVRAPQAAPIDRTSLIQGSMRNQRAAAIRMRSRDFAGPLQQSIFASQEALRSGRAQTNVKLQERMFGRDAGLDAQRDADLARAKAEKEKEILASTIEFNKAISNAGDLFATSFEKVIQSKNFISNLSPKMANEAARKGLGKQFSELQDLLGGMRQGRAGITAETVQGKLASMIANAEKHGADENTIASMKALQENFDTLDKAYVDHSLKVNNANAAHVILESNIKTLAKETKKAAAAMDLVYSAAIQDDRVRKAATSGSRARALRNVPGATGAEIGAADAAARRDRIAAGEGFQGMGGVLDAFRSNKNDALFALDDAFVDLGQSIKGGVKTAIKDVASGASSFKEAFGSIMAGIADKIANRGIDMGVDTIFSFLAKSKGGPIPRGYNQGGVVTGGSGVRDDVMTFMQGGEYVIKKSSAQKIGYSTLNAINSYASGGRARVSLAKDFMFTGDDPTRPTGGGFSVSRGLSTRALFRDDDPQTGRIFKRQETLASYLEYRRAEQARRDAAIQKVKDQKRARLTKAYIGAAGTILGGMKASGMFGGGNPATVAGPDGVTMHRNVGSGGTFYSQSGAAGDFPSSVFGMNRGGSPALVQGGEYIMSPRTTAKYGTGFMAELNRGRMPGFNMGGLVGGGGGAGGGITTNNVNLAINVDKSGQTSVQAQQTSGSGKDKEREDKSEIERQKQMGEAIRGVVLKEIERQQRPGGLLRDNASYSGGRRI